MEHYVALVERINGENEAFAEVVQQVHAGNLTTSIRSDVVVYLFAAYDRLVDILRLSGAVLRYLLNSSALYTSPTLRPVSPLEDAVEGLEAESASHTDVESWVRDDVLWGLLVDQNVADPEKMKASRERFPRFWHAADAGLEKRVNDIVSRHGLELLRRQQIHGQESADKWLEQILNRET